jgi:hypothetical protein
MNYTPMDINYLTTQTVNQNARNNRIIMENSGGNSAAAMNSLLASNYKGQVATADAYRAGTEYNNQNKNQAIEFNRGTNTFNSEKGLEAAIQNQNLDWNKAQFALSAS